MAQASTEWCRDRIAGLREPNAHELLFSLLFLDVASDTHPDVTGLIEQMGTRLPDHGVVAVDGGIEGEVFHPLDFSPNPGRPLRRLFPDQVIAADLDRLEADQQADGGWDVNFRSLTRRTPRMACLRHRERADYPARKRTGVAGSEPSARPKGPGRLRAAAATPR